MDAHKSPPLRPGLHRLAGIAFDRCSMDVHKDAASADPVYINLPVRAGLQHRCRFSPSTPAYNVAADSAICAASDDAVVFAIHLSRPGVLNDLVTVVQGIRLYLAGSYGPPPPLPPAAATGPAALPWYSAPRRRPGLYTTIGRFSRRTPPRPPQWPAPALAASPTPPRSSPPPPWQPSQPPHPGATATLVGPLQPPLQLQPASPRHRPDLATMADRGHLRARRLRRFKPAAAAAAGASTA
nr:atherin-like [Aegilops tauschii subsp. strangulata]